MDILLCSLACLLCAQAMHNNQGNPTIRPPKYTSSHTTVMNISAWLSGCYLCCCALPCLCCLPICLLIGIVNIANPPTTRVGSGPPVSQGPGGGIAITLTSTFGLLITIVITIAVTAAFIVFIYLCYKSNKADKVIELDLQSKFYENQGKSNQSGGPTTVVVVQGQAPQPMPQQHFQQPYQPQMQQQPYQPQQLQDVQIDMNYQQPQQQNYYPN